MVTRCFLCKKNLARLKLKVNENDFELANVPTPKGMSKDDKVCTDCYNILRKEHEYQLLPAKAEQEKTDTQQNLEPVSRNFCTKCGAVIRESDIFCSKCSTRISGTLPQEKPKLTRYESISAKFGIIMGIILIIMSTYTSNAFLFLMAATLFIINFVSLKTQSKPIKDLMSIINLIILVIAIINLLKLYE